MPSEIGELDGGWHASLRIEQLGQTVQTRVWDLGYTNMRLLPTAGLPGRSAGATEQPEQRRLAGGGEPDQGCAQHALSFRNAEPGFSAADIPIANLSQTTHNRDPCGESLAPRVDLTVLPVDTRPNAFYYRCGFYWI